MSDQSLPDLSNDSTTPEFFGRSIASIEQYTKAIAFFVVASYVVGLLVVNGYLSHIGISEFNLFKPQFVGAGTVFLVLVSLSTSGFWLAGSTVKNATLNDSNGWGKRLEGLFLGIMILLLSWLLFDWLSRGETLSLEDWLMHRRHSIEGFFIDRRELVQSFWLFCASALVGSAAVLAAAATTSKETTTKNSPFPSWGRTVVLVSFLGVASLLYIPKYSIEVYPTMPSYLGGRAARPVELAVKPDLESAFRSAEVPTGAVDLLFEGSDFYMIRRRDEDPTVYRVSKDDVMTIHYPADPRA